MKNKIKIIALFLLAGFANGQSIEFDDANSEYLQQALTSAYNDTTISYSAWFKNDDAMISENRYILNVSRTSTYDRQHEIYIDTSGNVVFRYRDLTAYTVTNAGSWNNDEWVNVIVICNDTSGATVYVNGSDAVNTTDGVEAFSLDRTHLTVGARYANSTLTNEWSGLLSDIAIWDDVLDANDISTLQTERASGVSSANLWHYWPLDETGTLGTIEDNISNWDLTAHNSPTASTDDPFDAALIACVYYIDTNDTTGPHDGNETNPFEDLLQLRTWAMDSNDPITRDESWIVYLSGSAADINLPVDFNIPTDATHTIALVGDWTGTAYDTTDYHVTGANTVFWQIDSNYVDVNGVQLVSSAVDDALYYLISIDPPGTDSRVRFDHCYLSGGQYNVYSIDTDLDLTFTDIIGLDPNAVYDCNVAPATLTMNDYYLPLGGSVEEVNLPDSITATSTGGGRSAGANLGGEIQ